MFSALEAVFWASLSTLAFHVLFLQDCGFSSVQTGTMMAINNVVAIISPLLWGYLADRCGKIRPLFLAANVLLVIATLALPVSRLGAAPAVLPTAAALAVHQLAYAGAYSLLEAWVIGICTERKGKWLYSHIRMWGAVGYSLFSVLLTYAARRFSISFAYYASAVFGLGVFFLVSRLPEGSHVPTDKRDKKETVRPWLLFRSSAYVLLLVYTFILHLNLYAASTFIPYLMAEQGLDQSFASAISGIRGIAELPIYITSAFLIRKFKPQGLLLLTGICYCIEHISYLLFGSMFSIVAAQILGGLAYGMYLSVAPQTARELSPGELHASAQTVIASSIFAGNIIASFLSGWIIELGSARMLYTLTTVLQIVITLSYGIGMTYIRRKNERRV